MLKRSGGQRQRIWNALLIADEPLSIEEIQRQAGGEPPSIRLYLNGLAKHGYTVNQLGWTLLKKTGPEAPAYSDQTKDMRDWNLDLPMKPAELQAAFAAHGGSINQFCIAIGLEPYMVTRLRQMMAGQRPVTTNIETAVKAWRADYVKIGNN